MSGRVIAIVPAAGAGRRMNADRPKQYLPLLDETVIEHSLRQLAAVPEVERIVVALDPDDNYWADLPLSLSKPLQTVAGGLERVHSVYNAAAAVIDELDDDDWLLVHDAARPCVRVGEIQQLLVKLQDHPCGGLLAMKVVDTMKQQTEAGEVQQTVNRELLWHALTPQVFRAKTLFRALREGIDNNRPITDESSAVEALGMAPLLVEGSRDNLKITRPEDLALAEFYLSNRY